MLLFPVNLYLLSDRLPLEEQGWGSVLKVIEWPIYFVLIDSEGFDNFHPQWLCVQMRKRDVDQVTD